MTHMLKLIANRFFFNRLWRLTKPVKSSFSSDALTPLPSPIAELPPELVVEILSYFIDDIRTLLACSMTCRSWYIATVPHLHYSLTTDDDSFIAEGVGGKYRWPGPLKTMYELHLLPLVKRFRIRMQYRNGWFTPDRLDEENLRYFSALENLQELGIDELQVYSFMPDLQRCFGHLSPTLRFLALRRPNGSSRQIVYFIGLFPNLQDLKLHYPVLTDEVENIADTTLVPLSSPPLRGRLSLTMFTREQIVKDMITLFGGLRFRHMDLFGVKCLPFLLEKCAETLETLRLYPTDRYAKSHELSFDLSQNKALRTLETTAESISYTKDAASEFLRTVLSSVAYPGMLDVVIIYRDFDLGGMSFCPTCRPDPVCIRHHQPYIFDFPWQLRAFREMHSARKFRLALCVNVYGCMEDFGVRLLESAIKKEEANGGFNYLACRPVITCEGRSIRTRPKDHYTGASGEWVFASAL